MFLSIISEDTEQKITSAVGSLFNVIKNFFVEIYEALVSLLEPFIGKSAAGIMILAIVFIAIAIIAVKLINKT